MRETPSPSHQSDQNLKAQLPGKMRIGFLVFGALMVIEVLEYVLGVTIHGGAWPFLAVLTLVGTWPIVRYFMHVRQLWRPEE